MTARRTSAYSLRVKVPPGHDLITALERLIYAATVQPLIDSHISRETRHVCIGFRAPGDAAAVVQAEETIKAYGILAAPAWELQTGYGVHRRTVTP